MPRLATELTQGQTFTRTAGTDGLADTRQRVFKVILSAPNEQFSPQDACGVYIGSIHPYNPNLICQSVSAKFDGDSRMVAIVTFDYTSAPSVATSSNREDQRSKSPEIRLASWTTDTTTYETPAAVWREWWSNTYDNNGWTVPIAPSGERYEGVTYFQSATTIRVEQMVVTDPMIHHQYVGFINRTTVKFGSLDCPPHTLMLRGVASTPHQETFNSSLWVGYKVSYDLSFKRNYIRLPANFDDRNGAMADYQFGWDRAQVLESRIVLNSGLGTASVDQQALLLQHVNYRVYFDGAGNVALADNTANKWNRAMVTIAAMDGGYVQRPASNPVAINTDGSPRNLTSAVAGKYLSPIIVRVQTQPDIDFSQVLNLRLPG